MSILKNEPSELARRHAQNRSGGIKALAQLGNDLLGDRAIARRGDDPRPMREMVDNTPQAPAGQNEIGIEKNLPMFGHRRTKIAECSMQRVGQCHSILVFRHDQIVESDETNRTNVSNARDRWMIIELGKNASLGQDHQLAWDLRG